METLRKPKHGDCLRAAVPWDGPAGNAGGNIVLMGHRDTVFPDGEATGAHSPSATASPTARGSPT